MVWGKPSTIKFLEAKEAQSGVTPPALLNQPVIEPEDRWLLRAFYDLDACRQSGFDINPISIEAIIGYCKDIMGIPMEERPLFFRVIKALDKVMMDHQHKISEAKSKTKPIKK